MIKMETNAAQADILESNLKYFRETHHSQCLFNRSKMLIPGLSFAFDDSGALHGKFTCNHFHQGYNKMVHGGVIAAIIDASMAQCLMGHGVIGYTADLSVRYRKPLFIDTEALLKTYITENYADKLYLLKCEIFQNRNVSVSSKAKFVTQ